MSQTPTDPGQERRVAVGLDGLCSVSRGDDVACRIPWATSDRLGLQAGCDLPAGAPVTLSIPKIGLLHGTVAGPSPDGGSAVSLANPSKLRRYLDWVSAPTGSYRERRDERIVPIRRLARVAFGDGVEALARIVDVSRSGIALLANKAVGVGERLLVGDRPGIVRRAIASGDGFGVEFDDPFDAVDPTVSFH